MKTSFRPRMRFRGSAFLIGGLVAVAITAVAAESVRLVSSRTQGLPSIRTGAGASMAASFAADGRFVVFASVAPDLVTNDPRRSAWDVFRRDLTSSKTERVSVFDLEPRTLDGDSMDPSISDDGRWIAFVSRVPAFLSGDRNGATDVYVRDMSERTARPISLEKEHAETGNAASGTPMISGDGRFVVFESHATNLTFGADDNRSVDLFLWDRSSGSNLLVSARENGSTGPQGASYGACLDRGATVVAFRSAASGLTTSTNGNVTDLYLWTREDRSIRRVELPGPQGKVGSRGIRVTNPVLSADGRYLAFRATAPDASRPEIDGIWWMDRHEGTLVRVVGDRAGTGVNFSDDVTGPAMSRDGRTLAFEEISGAPTAELRRVRVWRAGDASPESEPAAPSGDPVVGEPESSAAPVLDATGSRVAFVTTNAVPGATSARPGALTICVRDLANGVTAVLPGAERGEGWDFAFPILDLDGSRVLFHSDRPSGGDVADDNRTYDVFLWNVMETNRTVLSVAASWTSNSALDGWSFLPGSGSGVSSEGRFVLFGSSSAVGTTSEAARAWGVFRWDRDTAGLVRADVAPDGRPGNGPSFPIGLSADGRYALFGSSATNLMTGDTNKVVDIFRADFTTGKVELVSAKDRGFRFPRRTVRDGFRYSSDLEFVAFAYSGGDLVPEITGSANELYLRDLWNKRTICLSRNRVAEDGAEVSGGVSLFALGESARWTAFVTTNGPRTADLFLSDRTGKRFLHTSLAGLVEGLAVSDAGETVAVALRGGVPKALSLLLVEASTGTILESLPIPGGTGTLIAPRFAGDGQSLVFAGSFALPSASTHAVNPTDARYQQVYHLDLRTRRLRMCSIDSGGRPGVGNSGFADVSVDGRFVAFRRDPAAEAAGSSELWVYDVVAESARQLAGISEGGWLARPELSDDGKSIAVVSEAANLVSDDSNGSFDVLWMPLSSNDPTDSDGDGLLDGWENAHFRNLSENSNGDPDGDGVTNALEFESGTDPTDPLSLFRLAWSRGEDADPTLCWQSAGGVVYVVERAAASVASGFRPITPEIPGDGTPVCLPIRPSAASSGFFRVRLRRTD